MPSAQGMFRKDDPQVSHRTILETAGAASVFGTVSSTLSEARYV